MWRWLSSLGIIMILSSASALGAVEVVRAANDRIHRFTMENGIVGLVKADHSAPVVAIQLWFGTGSIHEDDYLGAGLAHYVEHMIFKGTDRRTPGDISREISDAGGRINAYTTFDRTVFHVLMPASRWEVGLDVLADAVQHAAFPEDEWEREQTVILQEMAMNRDDPQRELGRLLWRTAYRVHPHRHPVIGYRDVFLQTTREDLLNFFNRHYTPDNMIVAVAGAIDPATMEAAIRDTFADFSRRMSRPVILPAEPPQQSPRLARQTGVYEVSRAAWAWHTVSMSHKDAAALDVLAAVIGHGESSRLPLTIRDQQQLVHHIGAWSYAPAEPGLFGLSATFDPEQEEAVQAAVAAEIDRWCHEPFTEAEIDKARRQVLMRTIASQQDMRGQVDAMAGGEFYAGNPRFSEMYLAQLEAVTPATVAAVLDRYIQPDRQTLVLLTPQETATAPVQAAAADTTIAAPVRHELANGIPLIVREDHRLPLAYVAVALRGGTLTETPETQGITRFMADLLPRGTAHRSAAEMAETLESLGARMQPFAGLNSFGLQGMSLSEDLDTLLEMMAESLLDPAFAEHEIVRQRSRQLADLRAQRESPLTRADEMVREVLYPDHPYRWTTDGSEESVAALDRAALQQHLAYLLKTGNIAISVFGAVDGAAVRDHLNNLFARVPTGSPPPLPLEPGTPRLPAELVQREPRQQTIYLMAFPGVRLSDPRHDALNVLQAAMSGLASNLAIEVRDKRGLVYFVGAMNRAGLAPGRFMLYAGTYEEAVPEMQALMDAEVARILAGNLTAAEIERAQEQLVGDFHTLLQDNFSLAQISALNELYGLGFDYEFTKEDRIRQITAADIQHAAQSILNEDRRVISIVYPATNP
jgi:zinc protease